MDNLPPPEVIVKPYSLKNIFIAGFVFLTIILVVSSLYFLNIFNLSTVFNKSSKLPIVCPLEKKLCKLGKFDNTITYPGLTGDVKVLAMMDGKFLSDVPKLKKERALTVFTIINPDLGVKITYEFEPKNYTSSGGKEKNIKAGEPFGLIPKGNLIVSVQDLNTGKPIRLNPDKLVQNTRN